MRKPSCKPNVSFFFDSDTQLAPVATNANDGPVSRFTGRVHRQWNIGENPNGGYLVALAMRAFTELAPQHPDPITITAHYLRPGVADADCVVHAETVRTGRTQSTLRARLEQAGKARLEVLATLGDLSGDTNTSAAAAETRLTIPPPAMPKLEDCPMRSAAEQGVDLPLLDRLEIRLHPEQALGGAAGAAVVSGYIGFADQRPPDTHAAVLFADAFPPSVFGLLGVIGWVPTVELTVHVRRRPAPGWLVGRFATSDLAAGRMIEDGCLWDEQGHLIVQSRQIALVRQ